MHEAIPGKTYEHHKGGLYMVIALAEHSETKESLVVYQRAADQKVFVRPKAMFEDGRFTPSAASASETPEASEAANPDRPIGPPKDGIYDRIQRFLPTANRYWGETARLFRAEWTWELVAESEIRFGAECLARAEMEAEEPGGPGRSDHDLLRWVVAHAGDQADDLLPRRSHVGRVFGLGSTSATALCHRFDVRPDEEVGGFPCTCHNGDPVAGECMRHGAQECPGDEPLHFHHDGCPSCDRETPLLALSLTVGGEPGGHFIEFKLTGEHPMVSVADHFLSPSKDEIDTTSQALHAAAIALQEASIYIHQNEG